MFPDLLQKSIMMENLSFSDDMSFICTYDLLSIWGRSFLCHLRIKDNGGDAIGTDTGDRLDFFL